MLNVRDLTVRYGRVPAVQHLSLDVSEGEIVGLVGPNGAGKSTTLAAIFGLVAVADGEIAYDGESLVGLAPETIVRRGLGLVLEGRHIFNTLTVRDNLLLGTTASRTRVRSDAGLEPVLDSFPMLRKTFRAPAGNLSGGEQQQLAVARALLAEPRLLALDEPSLGLAPLMVDQIFETLAELRRAGVSILLVEQHVTRAIELADRTYFVRSGRITLSGRRAELTAPGRPDAADLGF